MGDQAHDFAERKIAEFQAEVRETYQQAQADAQEALSRFLRRFEKEDKRKREKVKAGELSEADYKAWRKGKILRSRQLSSTLDQVSRAMTEANQVAVAALAGRLPEVYAENANYAAFQVCEASGLDLAFSLVDAPTVQHMLTAGEALFSVPALDVAKDVAWNRRLMASQLTQGVLLGESIPKMSRRVQSVTGSNISTATRTARTAVTGAECAGRVSSYERAKGMGIKLKQEWVATLDNRTRHSHRKLDGEKAEVGGTFPNGCRFPGDPTARYAEICNCRCTLVAAVEGFETDDAKRASKLPKGMTYEEWKAGVIGKKADEPIARQGRDSEPSLVAQSRKTIEKIRASVREYIEAQRVFGLTAPGFSPHRRNTVKLPKAEYASVMSAINTNYKARFEGKTKGRIAVGDYAYTFEISEFNEYRITGRRRLE
ncbi:phage minor head protein [Ellagibacter isourolithinifaciens]|uniref:phage minor head protein n=1 Tax=Ellagibacter isourolithinifaciens TaxID=2137581 RepID=UPI003A8FC902